jgi:hypothetical protein
VHGATPTLQRPAPSQPKPSETVEWWRARPLAAFILRALIFVVPIVASVVTSYLVARAWSSPGGIVAGLGWWAALIVCGSASMLAVDRAAKRLLPLSTLLRMTLVFPDVKPSRFGIALRTGTTKQLEHRLAEVRANGLGTTERMAATTLLELVAALSRHDRLTRGHGERVRAYSALIGEELGLEPIDIAKLQWAGLIHDVGKLAVPAEILNKPGRLTDEEFDVIKTHPAEGMALVGSLGAWLGDWVLAVGEHHERWDGTGYPNRLAGTEISLAGRIVAVADVFDVITAARSYKQPQSPHQAKQELARHAGSQFDPEIVRAFLSVSIGRLRRVTWPLAWAADLPLLGASLSAPVTRTLAPALMALTSAVTGGSLATDSSQPPITSDIAGDGGAVVGSPSTTTLDTSETSLPLDAGQAPSPATSAPAPTATIAAAPTPDTEGTPTEPAATAPGVIAPIVVPTPTGTTAGTTPGTTPATTHPTDTIATTTLPAVTIPTTTLPAITIAPVTTPAITIPSITTPIVTTPIADVPSIETPAITIPTVTLI